jgi:glucokinase
MTLPLRPAVTEQCRYAVGVDVGGTKIAAGVVTPDGRILHKATAPTPREQDHVVQHILAIIEKLRSRYPDVAAVGVGAAGMIDWPSGHIRWAPNNSYSDLPLQQLLTGGSGLPTVVENDANAAAWAETAVGAGAGIGNVIALTIGTGIGAGIILNGELLRGETGIAGEAGHLIINPVGGELCGCGATGCLEAMASGTALGRAGRRAAAADPAGRLAQLAGTAGEITGEITGETVYQAARAGDPTARQLFEQLGYWLGAGIASLVNVFDPQLVILGGGLVTTGDLLLTPTRVSFERFVFARTHRKLPALALARMGTDAGLIGAALLALHRCPDPHRAEPHSRSSALLVPESYADQGVLDDRPDQESGADPAKGPRQGLPSCWPAKMGVPL